MSWPRAIAAFAFALAFVCQSAAASAFVPASPEARVGAFEVVASTLVCGLGDASRGQHQGIGLTYDENASGYRFAARGVSSLDALSSAAAAGDRGGLTAAGRALQKHGGRPSSAFPAARGNPAQINQARQNIVDDILNASGSTQTMRSTDRFGDVVEVVAPDGRGVRFSADGKFIGFLEPPR